MGGEGDAREEDSITRTAQQNDLNKSCDRCGRKKRRCDGENPCRRCVRLGETCTFTKRRPRARKPRPPVPAPDCAASDPSIDAPATLQDSSGEAVALEQSSSVSLKRCRLSPSPATGLVGMQENIFLSDYFSCVGFLPFTSQSNIRETLVKMFAGSDSIRQSESGNDYSTTEQHFDAIIPTSSQFLSDPSACVFWCAVALGALVKGRPIESVERYSRLARDALANVSGPPSADLARAWAIIAYMSDFCGDHDNFHVYLQNATAILCELQEEGDEALPEGLADVVKHGETIRLFIGELDRKEVESFCYNEQASPQMTKAATEGDICRFVMRSYRSFEQALYQRVADEHRPTADNLEGDSDASADRASADPVGAELLSGSRPHFFASVMREGAGSCSSGMLDMITVETRKHSYEFRLVEHAADRSTIRDGVGGLIINGTLVLEKIAAKDIRGALEKLESCGEVLQRYPGLCRFTMWSHITHMLMSYLAVIDGPRAREIYEQMRAAYNAALRLGTRPAPPFEEWEGLSSFCDNYNCRLMEYMVSTEHHSASCYPPPRERAAEVREKGPCDAPEGSLQQREIPSATGSDEGAEKSYVVATQPTNGAIDALGLNRKPERACDEESVGYMEHVSPKGRLTAIAQPLEPTLTTAPFPEVVLEAMVDSGAFRAVNDQGNSSVCAELGGQPGEALLPSVLCKGRVMAVDETEDEAIGVEDWLDVTHALLERGALGLDWE